MSSHGGITVTRRSQFAPFRLGSGPYRGQPRLLETRLTQTAGAGDKRSRFRDRQGQTQLLETRLTQTLGLGAKSHAFVTGRVRPRWFNRLDRGVEDAEPPAQILFDRQFGLELGLQLQLLGVVATLALPGGAER